MVTFEKKPGELPFVDVTPGDWFYDSVKTAYENGWMDGTSATTFDPQLSTTRGMITTILWRMEGEPSAKSANPFADVSPEMYYAKAVTWSAENVIVKGHGLLDPTGHATRAETAAMLARVAK